MIGYLPSPLPDETFLSVISRYCLYRGEGTNRAYTAPLIRELYGRETLRTRTDFPLGLQEVCKRLPIGVNLTPEVIIQNHSLFPLFRAFLSENAISKLLNAMKYGASSPDWYPGRRSLPAPKHLRFCPVCREDDIVQNGVPYWHRSHQIASVFLCHRHNDTILLETTAPAVQSFRISALTDRTEGEPLKLVSGAMRHYRAMAETAHALLIDPPELSLAGIKAELRHLLKKGGFITLADQVRGQELIRRMASFYGNDYLGHLNCALGRAWIERLPQAGYSFSHPIQHLLLINFLKEEPTPTQVIVTARESAPSFGDPPWPCVNPMCRYFKQGVILKYDLNRSYKNKMKLVGRFRCPICGCCYSSEGIVEGSTNDLKIISIAYGPLVKKELLDLHFGQKMSCRKIANELNLPQEWVKKGFKINKKCSRSTKNPGQAVAERETKLEERLQAFRTEIIRITNDHPELSRARIHRAGRRAYRFLESYDKKWLESHLPKPQNSGSRLRRGTNWKKRDEELAIAVEGVVADIVAEDPLKRATLSLIKHMIGSLRHLEPSRIAVKLPLTKAVLDRVCETADDFAVRRIRCAVSQSKTDEPLNQKIINHKARIWPPFSLRVAAAIEAALLDWEQGQKQRAPV